MIRYNHIHAALCCVLLLGACGTQQNKAGKHIAMGDPKTIITETDTALLVNRVRDLAEVNGTKNANAIDVVMRDVDSTKKSIDLNKRDATSVLTGLSVPGNGYTITLAGAVVKSGSRYLFQTGQVEENMTCQLTALQSCKVEQRTTSRLHVVLNGKSTVLTTLGDNTTEWQSLPGKECTFITHSKVDMKFREISAAKLFSVVKPIVAKSGLSKAEVKKINQELASASSTNSALYQTIPTSIELRISGRAGGKAVSQTLTIAAK